MATARSQKNYVQTAVRLPPELHKALHALAAKEERTYNGQIIAMLRVALSEDKPVATDGAVP